MLEHYVAQVRLLVNVLPDIAKEAAFALKGGTAINLFYRDMPRLSVDIDLTWLPAGDRVSALSRISSTLDRIGARIAERSPQLSVHGTASGGGGDTRILVRHGRVQIKIETYLRDARGEMPMCASTCTPRR